MLKMTRKFCGWERNENRCRLVIRNIGTGVMFLGFMNDFICMRCSLNSLDPVLKLFSLSR